MWTFSFDSRTKQLKLVIIIIIRRNSRDTFHQVSVSRFDIQKEKKRELHSNAFCFSLIFSFRYVLPSFSIEQRFAFREKYKIYSFCFFLKVIIAALVVCFALYTDISFHLSPSLTSFCLWCFYSSATSSKGSGFSFGFVLTIISKSAHFSIPHHSNLFALIL